MQNTKADTFEKFGGHKKSGGFTVSKDAIYDLEERVLATGDDGLIHDWRLLQTSDHVYYMCTKWFNDGDVHAYFSPYESPYEAFMYYMNVLRDIRWRLMEHERTGWQYG
jgi:alpha-amylase